MSSTRCRCWLTLGAMNDQRAFASGLHPSLTLTLCGALVVGCTSRVEVEPAPDEAPHGYSSTESSTLALTSDDRFLWVVNQDADSVSVIDTAERVLLQEIALTGAPPGIDPATGRFEPAATPRALAIVDDAKKVYVAAQSADSVYVIDGAAREVQKTIQVCTEPTGIAASPDGTAVYVVCHQSARILKIRTSDDEIEAEVDVARAPWGVSVSPDGSSLYVSHLLDPPGVSLVSTSPSLLLDQFVPLAEEAQKKDVLRPNGVARGAYGAAQRPGTNELWVAHVLLATGRSEGQETGGLAPDSTAFPTISTIDAMTATEGPRLLYRPSEAPSTAGAFSHVVCGPRQIAFTPDGQVALVVMEQSEDVLVFDGNGANMGLVRPLPSTMLEGIVVRHDGSVAYVDGRNTHDVTVLAIDSGGSSVLVDGPPINRLAVDPMPSNLRLGQRIFNTANSAAFPITRNFHLSCATCHIEGRTSSVTWLFRDGPRDVPSLAGGVLGTGFLLRQAKLRSVHQYDKSIVSHLGGKYDADFAPQETQLDALASYVNYAIPYPRNPNVTGVGGISGEQAAGKVVFDGRCASCHYGPALTDSGAGNPLLNLDGVILLHDIGTCVVADEDTEDYEGNPRDACQFDTPALLGVFATAPYFHDGSAPTLLGAIDRLPSAEGLSDSEKSNLVKYLESL